MSHSDHEHDRDSVDRRLAAVERALAEDEPIERVDRIDELEARIAELEAAVQALRGYTGSIRAINEDVERRADRALRKAQAIERHVGPRTRLRECDDRPDEDDSPSGAVSSGGSVLAGFRRWL